MFNVYQNIWILSNYILIGVEITCTTPICEEPGEVSFAIVVLQHHLSKHNIPATIHEFSQSINVDVKYKGSPNKPESDLTKDDLYFT